MSEIKMHNQNIVLFTGRLTRDPDLRFTQAGNAVVTVDVAINNDYKSKSGEWMKSTCFISVKAWNDIAERIGQNAVKGDPVAVQGALEMETWKDKQTQAERSKIVVKTQRIQLLKKTESAPAAAPASAASPEPERQQFTGEEDVPF